MRARTDDRDPAIERAHFDAVAAAKGRLYWADRTPAGRRRREIRAGLLAELLAAVPRMRILEVGCGTGEYTRILSRLTPATIVAVDVAPGVLALAGRDRDAADGKADVRAGDAAAPACLAAADVERLPFPDGTFDAVVGNAVLHHLRLERALPELLRVLCPGGRFAFAEPNILNPHVFVERTVPWVARRLDDSPGETAFVRWRIRRVLEHAGLIEVDVRPFDFLYPLVPPALIPATERLGRLLEHTPVIREIAGSLLIAARKRH